MDPIEQATQKAEDVSDRGQRIGIIAAGVEEFLATQRPSLELRAAIRTACPDAKIGAQ